MYLLIISYRMIISSASPRNRIVDRLYHQSRDQRSYVPFSMTSRFEFFFFFFFLGHANYHEKFPPLISRIAIHPIIVTISHDLSLSFAKLVIFCYSILFLSFLFFSFFIYYGNVLNNRIERNRTFIFWSPESLWLEHRSKAGYSESLFVSSRIRQRLRVSRRPFSQSGITLLGRSLYTYRWKEARLRREFNRTRRGRIL